MNPVQYVRDTIDLVHQIESRCIELGARLYNIRVKELWADTYDSYNEFLDTARITPTMASTLYNVHKTYVIDGGKKMESLKGIPYTSLYDAIPLIEKKGVDGAIVAASTLTRSDLRDNVKQMKYGRHLHEVGETRWGLCACGKFVRIEE